MSELDIRGRCCGRKPIVYKRGTRDNPRPVKFCDRCCRDFDFITGEQLENWAWKLENNEWVNIQYRKQP